MSRLLIRDLHPEDAATLQEVADAMKRGDMPFAVVCDGRRTLAVVGGHVQRFACGVLDGAGVQAPPGASSMH